MFHYLLAIVISKIRNTICIQPYLPSAIVLLAPPVWNHVWIAFPHHCRKLIIVDSSILKNEHIKGIFNLSENCHIGCKTKAQCNRNKHNIILFIYYFPLIVIKMMSEYCHYPRESKYQSLKQTNGIGIQRNPICICIAKPTQ